MTNKSQSLRLVTTALAVAGFAGLSIGAIQQPHLTNFFSNVEAQLIERNGVPLLRVSVDFNFAEISDYSDVTFEILDSTDAVLTSLPLDSALAANGNPLLNEDGTVDFVFPSLEMAASLRVNVGESRYTVAIGGASPAKFLDQQKLAACQPQCVSYVAQNAPRLVEPKCWREGFVGTLGNPNMWLQRAKACKYSLSSTPDKTFVLVMSDIGSVGHVAFSTQKDSPRKNASGFYVINFTDANWLLTCKIRNTTAEYDKEKRRVRISGGATWYDVGLITSW